MAVITKSTSIAEVLERCASARRIFDQHGLRGCGGVGGPAESLEFFATVHQANLDELLRELNAEIAKPSAAALPFQESIADYIYRRFFKAGVAVVLSIGAFWGAINLLQLAVARGFGRLDMMAPIHAHAHAMIFGWMGLFVMGFAYQSFPRFKNTTLWHPELANLTFYLMLAGIGLRVVAEMLRRGVLAISLASVSAAVEVTAVALFITILICTARKSIEPPVYYEKFIFAAYFWFLVQALLDPILFFAKATAYSQAQMISRVALLDGPLRDMQLLGFGALIIAGVSQRFVPHVYGLQRPPRDLHRPLFILINGALLLDIASYVALRLTGRSVFIYTLELAYVLMLAWAVLLVKQLGIFSRAAQPDRTLKFVRTAFVWLLAAAAMLPFFLPYGFWTRQGFAHDYMAAYHHAYTVGFVSMMIVGIASRVVPILAGLGASRLSRLWGPFLLLNIGCIGRVSLQITADWFPQVAFPLVGLTGFLEVAALSWWGIELWRVMNIAANRPKLLVTPVQPARPQLISIAN